MLAWIAGLALAALAYAVGPDRLIAGALDGFQRASWYFDRLAHSLTAAMREGLRAITIGLYGTFVALSLVGMRRRAHGPGGLIVVTIVFLLLVWGAGGDRPAANARWATALVVAALAALNATRRLARPCPSPRR
jgi:hypothetical protein